VYFKINFFNIFKDLKSSFKFTPSIYKYKTTKMAPYKDSEDSSDAESEGNLV
jgi:hypothetical protein